MVWDYALKTTPIHILALYGAVTETNEFRYMYTEEILTSLCSSLYWCYFLPTFTPCSVLRWVINFTLSQNVSLQPVHAVYLTNLLAILGWMQYVRCRWSAKLSFLLYTSWQLATSHWNLPILPCCFCDLIHSLSNLFLHLFVHFIMRWLEEILMVPELYITSSSSCFLCVTSFNPHTLNGISPGRMAPAQLYLYDTHPLLVCITHRLQWNASHVAISTFFILNCHPSPVWLIELVLHLPEM